VERDLAGACGVCKSALERDQLVVCSGCRALYHRECWLYNGGRCAAYGCSRAHERDPLPSLSAVPWKGEDPPSPERKSVVQQEGAEPIFSRLFFLDWFLLAVVLVIASFVIYVALL